MNAPIPTATFTFHNEAVSHRPVGPLTLEVEVYCCSIDDYHEATIEIKATNEGITCDGKLIPWEWVDAERAKLPAA